MKAGCEVVVAGYDAPPNGRYWGNSGQKWILVRDGLSAFDPYATLPSEIAALPVGPMQRR